MVQAFADEARAEELPPVLVPVEPLLPPEGSAAPNADPQRPEAGPSPAAPDPAARRDPSSETPPAQSRVVAGETELGVVDVVDALPSLMNVAGSAHRIDEAQLEAFEYDDAHQVLKQVPGVYMRGEDGYGLRPNIGIRGGNSDRSKKLTLTEDGILFGPAPYSAPAAYYFPVMTRITAVDVIKGPAAIRYGPNTVGGALNLTTRRIPERAEGEVDAAFGENFYTKLHAHYGISKKNWGVLAEGVWVRTDGFKELDGGGHTGFDKREFMLKLRGNTDPGPLGYHEFEAKLGYSTEISRETYLGLSEEDFQENALRRYRASALDRMKWHRTQVQLTHSAVLSDQVEVTTTAYRHDFFRIWRKLNGLRERATDYNLYDSLLNNNLTAVNVLTGRIDTLDEFDIRIGPNEREFVSQGVQTVAELTFDTGPVRHFAELGARYHFDSIRRDHTESLFGMEGGELVSTDDAVIELTQNQGKTRAVALYAANDIVWQDLTLSPGVRVELIHTEFIDELADARATNFQTAILPGLAAMYQATPEVSVLAGVHEGFSPAPPSSQMLELSANPEDALALEPESSVNYEVGARFVLNDTHAEAIGFFNDYSNLTTVCSFSSGCGDANIDSVQSGRRVQVWGVEALASHTFSWDQFQFPVRATYTLTRSEFLDSFLSENPQFGDVEAGQSLPYVPEHQASATAGVARGPLSADLSLSYTSESSEQAAAEQFTDEHWLLDVAVRYQLLDYLKLYATATNVFNTHYIASRRPFGARPGPPRLVNVGAKLSF